MHVHVLFFFINFFCTTFAKPFYFIFYKFDRYTVNLLLEANIKECVERLEHHIVCYGNEVFMIFWHLHIFDTVHFIFHLYDEKEVKWSITHVDYSRIAFFCCCFRRCCSYSFTLLQESYFSNKLFEYFFCWSVEKVLLASKPSGWKKNEAVNHWDNVAAESSKFAAQMLESGVKLFYYNVCTASPLELILCMLFSVLNIWMRLGRGFLADFIVSDH